MEVNPPMYLWPDDIAAYGSPLSGYFWEPLPDRPDLYVATRRLERGERQVLPGGVISEWHPPRWAKPPAIPLYQRETALYRCYDTAGDLIYVGIAASPERRWKQHSSHSAWWSEVVRQEVEWYGDRWLALSAEAKAIRSEDPKYNVALKHNETS